MSDAYVGKCQVETVIESGQTILVPSTVNARVIVTVKGRIRLHDTVNRISGRFTPVKGGFAIRDGSTTLVYYMGGDPVRLLVQKAFRAVVEAGRVAASVEDDRMTVTGRRVPDCVHAPMRAACRCQRGAIDLVVRRSTNDGRT